MKLDYLLIAAIVILLIIAAGLLIYEEKIKAENKIFKIILIAISKTHENHQTGETYYAEAVFNYENQEYSLVESNCRIARDYYLKASQDYKLTKSEVLSYGIDDNLINICAASLDSMVVISNNMFEACEHFELAARYYDKYFFGQGEVSDYNSGSLEIENMNEKIKAHDRNVELFNQQSQDFQVELSRRLK